MQLIKTQILYCIAQSFDGGNFDVFDGFIPDSQNYPSNFVGFQKWQVHSDRHLAICQNLSVKDLNIQYPSKFTPIKILCYTVDKYVVIYALMLLICIIKCMDA